MTYPGQGDGHGPDEPRDEYPPYPSTPHPEDNPGYAGHQQYGQYSDYNAYDTGGAAPATGTGKVHVMQAVSWAFKAIFRSWPLWILGALAFFVLTFLLSFIFNIGNATAADPTAVNVGDIVVAVVSVVVSVLIYNAALRQVDNRTVGWADLTRNVNFWPTLGTLLLVQLAVVVILTVIALPFALPMINTEMTDLADDLVAMAFLGRVLGLVAFILFVSLFLCPLTTFIAWYVADRRAGIGEAVKLGVRAGLANYGRLLLFFFVSGILIMIAALVTFGLAMIFVMPVYTLIQAMLYRQASAGPLPAPADR